MFEMRRFCVFMMFCYNHDTIRVPAARSLQVIERHENEQFI